MGCYDNIAYQDKVSVDIDTLIRFKHEMTEYNLRIYSQYPARYQLKTQAFIFTKMNDQILDNGCISIDTHPKNLAFQAKKEPVACEIRAV